MAAAGTVARGALNQPMLIEEIAAILVTTVIVILVVGTHYEGLRFFTDWFGRTKIKPRRRVVLAIFGLLTLHSIEIWLFGIGFWLLDQGPVEFGTLVGDTPLTRLVDYVYFSTTVYSTLGFGDLVPTGPMRLLAGIESVTGLLLITWSASFTYLEMVRYWGRKD